MCAGPEMEVDLSQQKTELGQEPIIFHLLYVDQNNNN